MSRTYTAKAGDIERKWYVVDAANQTLGRLATRVAMVLQGKHKPMYTPYLDTGDFIIVVNAAKVRLTGKKLDQKIYYRHTGYLRGLRAMVYRHFLEKTPERVIEKAVRGMLPKGSLGRDMYKKLKVYPGAVHPHEAQKPEPLPEPCRVASPTVQG